MQYDDQLNIRIVDTVFDPDRYGVDVSPADVEKHKPEVHYHETGGSSLYKVWILLAGPDLLRVESVTYRLHETFDPSIRVVPRTLSNQDCRITIWTWGVFQINATILDKLGRTYSLSHQLTYGDALETDTTESIKYVPENPELSSGAKLIA